MYENVLILKVQYKAKQVDSTFAVIQQTPTDIHTSSQKQKMCFTVQ